ncbi:MAG: DUF433 domain-containing protein [Deltaproteobacteria bacterium]|nr:DUF433 domain-containing protein [Deltaproteobacteria bacterium]
MDPQIQHGKPVVHGTLVPIIKIMGGLSGGMANEEITPEYDVTEQDARAALIYVAELSLYDRFQELLIEMLGLLQAPDGVVVQVKIELEVRNYP